MPPKKRERSPSSTPVPSTEAPQNDGSQIPAAEWEAMQSILQYIYDYRMEDGLDPSKLFHRKVNKRVIPEYYDTIKEPIALSTIKQKIHVKSYSTFAEFVRDFALIPHNAQVFNRPDSGAFQDALVIKEQLEQQLQRLIERGLISKEVAELPDLGEIPTYEDVPMEDAEGEQDEEEESDEEGDDDDEEDDPDLDDEGRPTAKKRRGRPPGSKTKRPDEGDEGKGDGKRARGRPPKLLTPMEARILAVLKGIRKPKNKLGQLIIKSFDRLPDKAVMPEYYTEIKHPMAYDVLKRKVKRKKYSTVEAFMADVNLMLNNAKEYNQDDSQIFKDAVQLQVEAGKLYDAEKAKPDDTFADDEGKIPMPTGILHNGELYKVGDWIHVQNINDLTKPIPAQVYRTYKNPNGQSMVNVCWYYRPEQTVHRFDKHFLHNEIVKTGRYRDHNIEEVEGKCFVMFYTRYFKGRPRGISDGMEVYVCKDRYNEERHQFNTIKTWASCLPDEVRDKDYEMNLFDHTRKMKKHPSPIAYLLKDEQKETDDLPKVTWGAEGAPPKIGAVHRRPRNEKDSPPPEPTPPPPPPKVEAPAIPRPVAPSYQSPAMSSSQPQSQQQRPPSTGVRPTSFTAPHTQSSYAQQHPQSSSNIQQRPTMPHQQHSYTPATPHSQPQMQPRPMAPASTYHQQQTPNGLPPNPTQYQPRPNTANYRDPPAVEVYILPDQANQSIPAEIREQYQRDAQGRVLFFTTPPVPNTTVTSVTSPDSTSQAKSTTSTPNGSSGSGRQIIGGHSVRYLAWKARRDAENNLKSTSDNQNANYRITKLRGPTMSDSVPANFHDRIHGLKVKALNLLEKQLLDSLIKDGFTDRDLVNLSAAQRAHSEQMQAIDANRARREQMRKVRLGPPEGGYKDDFGLV